MTIFDPLRRKEVPLTPEERVRSWFITVLQDTCKVPLPLMGSEVELSLAGKPLRADIVVYDRSGSPAVIVECKRPEVEITADVAYQALRYDAVLSVNYIILTNGNTTYCYKRESTGFVQCRQIPVYEQMICKL